MNMGVNMLRKSLSCRLQLKNNELSWTRYTDWLESPVWETLSSDSLTCIFRNMFTGHLRSFLLAWIHHDFINDWPAICWYAVKLAGVVLHFSLLLTGPLEIYQMNVFHSRVMVLQVTSPLKTKRADQKNCNVFVLLFFFLWCFHVLTSSGWEFLDTFCVLTCVAPNAKEEKAFTCTLVCCVSNMMARAHGTSSVNYLPNYYYNVLIFCVHCFPKN